MQANHLGKFLRFTDISKLLKLSKVSIHRMIKAGKFPKPIEIYQGSRIKGWPESMFNEWYDQRIIEYKRANGMNHESH